MADDEKAVDEAPVKRGPGRPRKNPLPAPKDEAPSASDDPRIGTLVHETATAVGFDDGSQYRVSEGVIVEKL